MAIIDELVAILGFDLRGEGQAKKYQKTMNGLDQGLGRLSATSVALGGVMANAITAGFRLAGQAMKDNVEDAVRFEESIADINKVVDATPTQMAALTDGLLKMSREIPIAADQLAAISAEAGAAGVAFDDLDAFTRQVATAVTAFDLPAQRVGETMSKLANVFQFNVEQLGMFNDTVNHLSNNMAAKAGELLNFTNRAAGAANQLGLTADQLAGVGAALIAAGVVPETAARGFNALATRIQTDAKGVDDALKGIGTSTEELQKALSVDGDAAILNLFTELSKLDVTEQAVALKALVGQDFSDDFAKFLANPDLLAQGLRLANDEAGKLGSVQKEYNARAATTRAHWDRTKNILKSVGIVSAGPILSAFVKVSDKVFEIVEAIDAGATSAQTLQNIASALGFDVSADQAQGFLDTLTATAAMVGTIAANIVDGLGGALSVIGSEFVPVVQAHFQQLFDVVSGFDFSGLFDTLTPVLDTLTPLLSAVSDAFEVASGVAVSFAGNLVTELNRVAQSPVFQGLVDSVVNTVTAITGAFAAIGDLFGAGTPGGQLLDGMAQFIALVVGSGLETVFALIAGGLNLFATGLNTLVAAIKQVAAGDFLGALRTMVEGLEAAILIVADTFTSVFKIFNDLVDKVTGFNPAEAIANFGNAAVRMKAAFVEGMSGLGDVIKNALLSGIEFAINKAIDAYNASLGRITGEIDRVRLVTAPTTETTDSVVRTELAPEEIARRQSLPIAERVALAKADRDRANIVNTTQGADVLSNVATVDTLQGPDINLLPPPATPAPITTAPLTAGRGALANAREAARPPTVQVSTPDAIAIETVEPLTVDTPTPLSVDTPVGEPLTVDTPAALAVDTPVGEPLTVDTPAAGEPLTVDTPTPLSVDTPVGEPLTVDTPTPLSVDTPVGEPLTVDTPAALAVDTPVGEPLTVDTPAAGEPLTVDTPTPLSVDTPVGEPLTVDTPAAGEPLTVDTPAALAVDTPVGEPLTVDTPAALAVDTPVGEPLTVDTPAAGEPLTVDTPTPLSVDTPVGEPLTVDTPAALAVDTPTVDTPAALAVDTPAALAVDTPAPITIDTAATGPLPVETITPQPTETVSAIGTGNTIADRPELPDVDLSGLIAATADLAAAASAFNAIQTTAPELLEQTINNDYTKVITNNITNNTTVNQTVTGAASAGAAGTAANKGANRGTDRALTVNNQGAAD